MRQPLAARWRRTLSRWPAYPRNRRERAPSASRCRSLRQGGPRNPQSAPYVQTSSLQAGRCWNTWHGKRCTPPAPAKDKEAASHILQGRAQRSLWHAPYAQRPPPPPGGRPRGGPGGGRGGGRRSPGGRRCSPPGVHPLGTGPLVGPPGSGLPTPHGPGTPRGPGCPRGPRSDAGEGQLTPG